MTRETKEAAVRGGAPAALREALAPHRPVYWGPAVNNAGVRCACGGWDFERRESFADHIALALSENTVGSLDELDVERLAEALHRAGVCQNWSPGYGFLNSSMEHEDHHGAAEHTEATRVAAEYRRLTATAASDASEEET